MVEMRDDGSLDTDGAFYMFRVFVSEGLIYLPTLSFAIYIVLSSGLLRVTCNSREVIEVYLLANIIANSSFILGIAPLVTNLIAREETYWIGLALFHSSAIHHFVRLYIIWDALLFTYGVIAVASADPEMCSMRLPRTVLFLVVLHGLVLLWRVGVHITFPAYVDYYSRRNPLKAIPKDKTITAEKNNEVLVEETAEMRAKRIKKLIDMNFHMIQSAWHYRVKLPDQLKLPSTNTPSPVKVKPQPAQPAMIVVRPKTDGSGWRTGL